ACRREQRMVERQLLAGPPPDAGLRGRAAAPDHPGPPGRLLRRGDIRRLGTGQPEPAGLADEPSAPGRGWDGRGPLLSVGCEPDPRVPPDGGAGRRVTVRFPDPRGAGTCPRSPAATRPRCHRSVRSISAPPAFLKWPALPEPSLKWGAT